MHNQTEREGSSVLDAVIVGAGFSGIGAAIRLRELGITDFVVLEKANSVGGTWRDNTYPGCACDVPSSLYSYSFAQKQDWSRVFAGQAEILEYIRDVVRGYRLEPWIAPGQEVNEARWDADQSVWVIHTGKATWKSRILIGATGYLHEPQIPDIPGLKEFPGTVFHSSRWDHNADLRGKQVAVIGTGASAIQFVPQIQPLARELHVFQKTPQWILPKPDGDIPDAVSNVLSLPVARSGFRSLLYRAFEVFGIGFRQPALLRAIQRIAELHLRTQVPDENLRRKLTPDYVLGCKRVLLSGDYYPALSRPNVTVHASRVNRIEGDTLFGDTSSARADVIILGTGFYVSEQPLSRHVFGKDGRSLADVWQGSPEAYKGTTITGFPNAFLLLGPNLAIGNNSAFVVIESQLAYITSAIRHMRARNLRSLEVTSAAQARYNETVQRDLQKTVWNTGGCLSYYIDKNGRNSIGFPWSSDRMQEILREFDPESYVVST